MAHDEKVPRASEASAVPLRTFRRRRRRKLESGNKFRQLLWSIFLHALIYSLLYTILWKCPRHPESSGLCPIVNKVTEPFVPIYNNKVAPYVEPALQRIQKGYEAYAEPVVERAASAAKSQYNVYAAPYVTNVENAIKDQYDEKARVHVEKLLGLARHVYDDSLIPLWESSQPYVIQALRRANAVAVYSKDVIRRNAGPIIDKMVAKGSELAKLSWAKVVQFYNDVIVVKSLQLYFDHVEPAVLRVKDRIFLKSFSEEEVMYECDDENYECDDYEEGEEGDVENDEDIESVVTSTITRTISRTAVSSTGSVHPGNAGTQTPEITPPAEHIDPEVAEHQLEIEKDIISWTSKFRTAGKNAVSSFTMEIDSLFRSAQDMLLTAAEANLLRAQIEIESIFDTADAAQVPAIATILTAKADAVRAQAVEAANSVLRDAESIRSSTLDIFKTVTDIGLQELGRKWAFMEGITWQDWKEYHTLKSMADDFAQVIVDIPIDDKIVQKFLSDFDDAVANWIAHAEAKISNVVSEEAALTKVADEAAADQLNESAVEDDHLAANEEIAQTGNSESSSTISVSSSSAPDVSGTDGSTSIASTSTTASGSSSLSSANTQSSTLLTSTSIAYALSHDEL
ncbi:uncharacterized protein V1513DRAFT_462638 [Lipomyces chichibuensis]|uniref:uncharacterized protein n=1 Tax=Lipomyces chichibuensis TaxID=1546026 RepID=UPI003343FAD0